MDNTAGLVKNISFAKHGQNYLSILDRPIATKTLENEFANFDVKNIWYSLILFGSERKQIEYVFGLCCGG